MSSCGIALTFSLYFVQRIQLLLNSPIQYCVFCVIIDGSSIRTFIIERVELLLNSPIQSYIVCLVFAVLLDFVSRRIAALVRQY